MSLHRRAIPLSVAERKQPAAPLRIERADPVLMLATLLLISYGLVMAYSATFEDRSIGPEGEQFMLRAVVWAVVGLAVMGALSFADYRWIGALSPLVYVGTVAILVAVLFVGESTFGAQRWLHIGALSVQPSELAKVAMIVVLARFFADRQRALGSPLTLLAAIVVVAVPTALVYRQPDLGTSLVFLAIFGGVAFLSGARLWQLVALAAAGVAAIPAVWSFLADYQRARLFAFFDPYADPLGAGWNIIQSLIAIGSGGLFGKGLTAGTQSPLGYLPIAESDFIFANLAEDLGFVGAMILFALYMILLLAALRISFRASDAFGALLGAGVVAMLGFQIFVNVGMSLSIMPVTGIPLPFISHGGSNLIAICAALGLLQSVAMRRVQEGDGH